MPGPLVQPGIDEGMRAQLPIEPMNYGDCLMHGRKCLTSFLYLHAIATKIQDDDQGDELYHLMTEAKG